MLAALPLTTPRLLLRRVRADDVDPLHALMSDPDVVRWVPYDVRTRAQVEQAVAERLAPPAMDADGQVLRVVVERRDDGRFVGELTLMLLSIEDEQAEIGFMLAPAQQGQGFGAEATTALLDLAFGALGAHRVVGRCDLLNPRSAALMRRVGMRQEALFVHNDRFKGQWSDLLVFAVLADEHTGRR